MQDPTPIDITSWCICLANLGQKRNLHFLPLSPMFKKRSHDTALCWLRI